MKKRSLIVLGAILAVLLVLVIVKQAGRDRPTIQEQVDLAPLVPEDVEIGDIERIEMYLGSAPSDKVLLERVSGSEWQAVSLYDAPADEDKLSDYLETLVGLQGEFRAEAEAQEALERFNLTDETAFHVVGYGEGDEPLFHLLNGKSPSPEQTFMRTVGGDRVFVESANLRREAGLWSDDATDPPKAERWVDMTVTDIEQDEVASYAVTTPVKRLVFEKREVEPEAPDDAETTEEDGGAEPEYEWVLAEGGPAGLEFKESGLLNAVRAAAQMNAATVVDPAEKAEWGLETPGYRVELAVEGDETPTVLEGGRPEGAGDGYVTLPDRAAGLVYEVSSYSFEQAFGKGSNLFELPAPDIDAEQVTRIELERPNTSMVFEKSDGAWSIVEPDIGLEPMEFAVSDLATSLAGWEPADYADAGHDTGLDAPEYVVRFTVEAEDQEDAVAENGEGAAEQPMPASETYVIEIGAATPGGLGRFARYDGGETVLIMSASDFDKIAKDPNDVYDLALIDADSADFASINVSNGEASFVLDRGEAGWQVTIDGETVAADQAAVSDLTYALSRFQPMEIAFGESELPEGASARIEAATADGTTYELAFGPTGEDMRAVLFRGQVYRIASDEAAGLLVTPESLRAAETPEAETQPAGEDAAAIPEEEGEDEEETPDSEAEAAPAG